MRFIKRRSVAALAALSLGALALAGCSTGSGGSSGGGDEKFTIGVSNALLSQSVRVQLLDSIEATAQEYIDDGVLDELVIENADTDVQGQVKQIQNLINRGVDAIIVDPSSDTALNAILTQAIAQGIHIIAVDNFLDLDAAATISVDFPANFQADADWVIEQMGGEGDLLRVDGIAGVPANQYGVDAVDAAIADHSGVSLAATLAGNWDTATAVQVTDSWLSSGNVPNGVWSTGGGVAYGVLQALVDSGIDPLPPINGEGTAGWLRLADSVKQEHPDFKIYTTNLIQPGAQGEAAVRVAMGLLEGGELTSNSITLPSVEINDENYAEYLEKAADLPDSAALTVSSFSQDDAESLWFK